MATSQSCSTCRYSNQWADPDGIGMHCRRHPPKVNRDPSDFAEFPLVFPSDWCGEFQPKSEEK
jgi:hypothetical protein